VTTTTEMTETSVGLTKTDVNNLFPVGFDRRRKLLTFRQADGSYLTFIGFSRPTKVTREILISVDFVANGIYCANFRQPDHKPMKITGITYIGYGQPTEVTVQ
jgi:hypothetical protein